jgi:hypothetical protein
MRFFAGFTMPQAAAALQIPLRTAERDWTYARAWLHRELDKPDAQDSLPRPSAELTDHKPEGPENSE